MNEDAFAGRLLSGERILWSGRPRRGLLLTASDIFLIPFSVMWCGFAIVWTFMASQSDKASIFFILWGLMFVLIGLYMVVGRFVTDAWIRRNTNYAVTNKRIMIDRSGPFARFMAANLNQLPNIEIEQGANGCGSIRFGSSTSMWSPALDPTPQFLAIEDVRHVFDLIQRTINTTDR